MGEDAFESSAYARALTGKECPVNRPDGRYKGPRGSRYYVVDTAGTEVVIDYSKGKRKKAATVGPA